MASIDFIDTQSPYLPIRTLFSEPNHDFSTDKLRVFERENTPDKRTTPATLELSDTYEFRVKVSPDSTLNLDPTTKVTLIGTPSKSEILWTFSSDVFTLENIATDIGLRVYGKVSGEHPEDLPWGVYDSFSWKLVAEGSSASVYDFSQTTQVELYGLPSDLPEYFDDGVPYDLLRIFFRPVFKKNFANVDDWVAWVVKLCHASKWDTDCTTIPDDERIHWYLYEAHAGAFFFSGGYNGAVWEVDAWLAARDEKGAHHFTNCFDQASLVQTVVTLGVGGQVADDSKNNAHLKNRVGFFYKDPFGYIKTTDLVGWGKVNSPFFLDVKSENPQRIYDESDLDDESRQSFGSHSFVRYVNIKGEERALDACAGPATGNQSIKQYLEDTIDDGIRKADGIGRSTKRFSTKNRPYDKLAVSRLLGVWGLHPGRQSSIDHPEYTPKFKLGLNEVLWSEYETEADASFAALKKAGWGNETVHNIDFKALLEDIKIFATGGNLQDYIVRVKPPFTYAVRTDGSGKKFQQVSLDIVKESEKDLPLGDHEFSTCIKFYPSANDAFVEASLYFAVSAEEQEKTLTQLEKQIAETEQGKPFIFEGRVGKTSTDIIFFANVLVFVTKSSYVDQYKDITKQIANQIVARETQPIPLSNDTVTVEVNGKTVWVHVKCPGYECNVSVVGVQKKVFDITQEDDSKHIMDRQLRVLKSGNETLLVKITDKATLFTQYVEKKVVLP